MPISGTWKKAANRYNTPSGLHVADPAHSVPGHDEPQFSYTYTAPPDTPAIYGEEYFTDKFVVDTQGMMLDQTPEDHSQGLVSTVKRQTISDYDVPGGNAQDSLAETLPQHALNQGATLRSNYNYPGLQFQDERYTSARIAGFGPEFSDGIPDVAGGGRRGKNGLTVNNPLSDPPQSMSSPNRDIGGSYGGHSFAYGTVEQNWVDRKFAVRIIQRHDYQANTGPNTVYVPPDAQPLKNATPYNSPFSWLARAIKKTQRDPQNRSTPRDMQEYIQYDGAAAPESIITTGAW